MSDSEYEQLLIPEKFAFFFLIKKDRNFTEKQQNDYKEYFSDNNITIYASFYPKSRLIMDSIENTNEYQLYLNTIDTKVSGNPIDSGERAH